MPAAQRARVSSGEPSIRFEAPAVFPSPQRFRVPSTGVEGSFAHPRRGATLKATILLHCRAGRAGRDQRVPPCTGSLWCKPAQCCCVRWIHSRVSTEGQRFLFASSAWRKKNVVSSPLSFPAAGTYLCPALGNWDSVLWSQPESIPHPILGSAVQKPPGFPKGGVFLSRARCPPLRAAMWLAPATSRPYSSLCVEDAVY